MLIEFHAIAPLKATSPGTGMPGAAGRTALACDVEAGLDQ